MLKLRAISLIIAALFTAGCATETHQRIQPQAVASYGTAYSGIKYAVAVDEFQNQSSYMQGIFSNGQNRLGNQAQNILTTHLQQSGRFSVVDRQNLANMEREANFSGQELQIKAAQVAIKGGIVEFGRKTTGDHQLFGILGSGKQQTAYAKVSLNVVNVNTSEVVYSAQGAGEYALSDREIIGFGGASGYDSTLNAKVLNLAITEAINTMVNDLESGAWKLP